MNKMLITSAGLAEIRNAEQSGTAPVVLSHVAFGTGQYTATADMTKLKSEFKRFDSVAGGAIADNIIHLTIHDNSTDKYTVNEIGVFTDSGTLFAVYSATTPIMEKAATSETMLAIDIALTDIDPDSISFGDTNIVLNPATTTTAGIVELATDAEAKSGTDTTRAITPAAAKAARDADANIVHRTGNETIAGSKSFTGNLIISKDSPFVLVSQNDIVKGTTPSANQYMGVAFADSEGHATENRLGLIESKYQKDGSSCLSLSAYKPEKGSTASAGIDLVYPADGNPYATAPTPAAGDNSTKIATTAWVNAKAANFLPLAGGTVAGVLYSSNGNISYQGNTYRLAINGGAAINDGASLIAYGKNESNIPGAFQLCARDGTNSADMLGKPDGALTWQNKNIVRSVNGTAADAAGNVSITSVASATSATKATQDGNGKVIADTYLALAGGTMSGNVTFPTANGVAFATGGVIKKVGSAGQNLAMMLKQGDWNTSYVSLSTGKFELYAGDGTTVKTLSGNKDGILTWDGKYVLNNSFNGPSDSNAIILNSGTATAKGAYFRLYGSSHSSGAGQFNIGASNGTTSKAMVGKADGTLTWDGINISAMSMPSNTRKNLTLGSSGTTYTAPADGWICLVKKATANGQYLHMSNDTAAYLQTVCSATGSGATLASYVPVKKGDSVNVLYTAGGTTTAFFFAYAEGAKHLA